MTNSSLWWRPESSALAVVGEHGDLSRTGRSKGGGPGSVVCEDSDLDAHWAGALLPWVVACAVSWPHTQLRLCSLLHPSDPFLPSRWQHHRRGQELPAPFFGISTASEHPQLPAPFPAACPCPSWHWANRSGAFCPLSPGGRWGRAFCVSVSSCSLKPSCPCVWPASCPLSPVSDKVHIASWTPRGPPPCPSHTLSSELSHRVPAPCGPLSSI